MGTFLYDFIVVTAAPGVLWFRPKRVYENENAKKKVKGGALMICNHITLVDPLYLMLTVPYRRHHFICAKELLNNRFNTFLFTKGFLCIPIDRDNFGMSSFRTIIDHLKKEELCVIFPTGHVETEKKSLEIEEKMSHNFKSGMVMMALQSKKPIWPVYLKKRKSIFDRLVLAVGEPIDVCSVLGERPTMARIQEMCDFIEEKEAYLGSLVE